MSKLSDALLALAKNGVLNGMQRTDIADELVALAAQAQELERDAKRFKWALPILSGDNNGLADRRALALAGGILAGNSAVEAIDAAIDKERGQ